MKRGLIYITIFLMVCGAIRWLSGAIDYAIMNWYTVEIKSELNEIFEANDTLYIDGTMLSIYLYDSMETFEKNGQRYDYFEGDNQYNKFKKNTYKVERITGEGYWKITQDSSHPITKVNALVKMDKVMMWRKIFSNIITLIIGLTLWGLYENKYFYKFDNKTSTEIPV